MFRRLVLLGMVLLPLLGGATASGQNPKSMDRHMDPEDYLTRTVKVLRTTNKAQTNSYVPLVYTMRNNNPFNVIRHLIRAIQLEEGDLFTFVSPEGQGGKVLFIAPDYMEEELAALVKSLDKPGLTTSSGTMRVYRQLKHRRANDSDPHFLETAASFSTGNGSDFLFDTWANALWWADAPSGAHTLDNALTDWLDVPTHMASVTVKIYELDAYNDGTIGLDYIAWKNGPGANLFAVGAFSEYASFGRATPGLPAGAALPNPASIDQGALGLVQGASLRNNLSASGYNYAYRYEVDSSFFDFLATKGKARVLNRAKLAMLDSHPASLSAGDQILYYAAQTSDPSGIRDSGAFFAANGGRVLVGTTNEEVETDPESIEEALLNLLLSLDVSGGNITASATTTSLEPVETGLSIEMDNVIAKQSITIEHLAIEWSDYNAFDDSGFPQINHRSLHIDEHRLGLGDEIVIGGLKRQVTVKSTKKVPILGSLPIIGYAFGGETTQNKQTELVVALKAVEIHGYAIAQEDKDVIDAAVGDADIAIPETTWGFDQYGIDKAKGKESKQFK